MSRLIVPLLVLMAVALAACSGRTDEEAAFTEAVFEDPAFAGDAAASSVAGGITGAPGVEAAADRAVEPQLKGAPEPPVSAAFAPPAPRPAAAPALTDGAAGVPVADLVSQDRIIVRTVDMRIVVVDVAAAVDAAAGLAREMGGWVVSSNRSAKHTGFVSIRVPADRLDEAIQRLRDSAVDVKSEVSSSRDVTDEYVDLQSRLKNQKATEEALLKLLDRSAKVEDALKIRETLTTVQEDVELLQGKIKLIEQTSAFSLLNLTLELDAAEMPSDAGEDQAAGVGQFVRFRASFSPPEGIEDFAYTWDFGDGSPIMKGDRTVPTGDEGTRETATVTHVYSDERDSPYIAQFEITGTGEGGVAEGKDTLVVTITRIPTVEVFAGERVIVDEGEVVELDGSFTRPAGITDVEYRWTFGDGSAPDEGKVAEGVTNVLVSHVYPDHRPFPFTARLTITAQSEAGEVEGSATVQVRVLKSEGWVIGGWSLRDQLKTAVRSLSAAGQWSVTGLIWLGIFSPVIAIVAGLGLLARRRVRSGWRKRGAEAAEAASDDTAEMS